MQDVEDPGAALARRLRALRETTWPRRAVTQAQLAAALGGDKPLSVPLISSWESPANPKMPPVHRLEAYARFFATERSLADRPRLLDDLSPDEDARRLRLRDELVGLRSAALGDQPRPAPSYGGLLRFPDGADIVVVCGKLRRDVQADQPYTDPTHPDYDDFYAYTDPRALLELYGHLRAVNPASDVKYGAPDEMEPRDYAKHLILIGGVDWNVATDDLFNRVEIPIRQVPRVDYDDVGHFEVREGETVREFASTVREVDGRRLLTADVIHFYRGVNPYRVDRTVTFFNANYARGVLAAVRAVTDPVVRSRNEQHCVERFAGHDEFSILTRVPVVNGAAMAADWTAAQYRLHEWSRA